MFTIQPNQSIIINKGDDSGKFTLFVNKGTAIEPIKHEFVYNLNWENSDNLNVSINRLVWEKNNMVIQKGSGEYSFIYNSDKWYLDNAIVSLADFGISVSGTLINDDYIRVTYYNFIEEIYFYIFEHNSDSYLLKKIFTTEGKVITEIPCGSSRIEKNQDIISEDGDMILKLDSFDTSHIDTGEYLYQIKAKIYKDKKYSMNTITNIHNIYVVD